MPKKMINPMYECIGGPLDGERLTVQQLIGIKYETGTYLRVPFEDAFPHLKHDRPKREPPLAWQWMHFE